MASPGEIALEVGFGVVAGAVYGLIWYARNSQKPDDEPFQPTKLAATLVVGAVVGGVLAGTGGSVESMTVESRLIAYAGAITLTEGVLKTGFDWYRNQ